MPPKRRGSGDDSQFSFDFDVSGESPKEPVMNRYGERAQRHYQQFLAPTYAMIPDHEVFFSTLGQEIEDQVFELRDQLAGPDLLGEGYLEKVGRLNAARLQAEEVVLAELLPTPEETQDENDPGSNPAAAWAMSFQQLKQNSLDR